MALEELTFESPEYYEREGGRGERRVFQTTDLADIPSRGDTASSPFTAGYRIDSVSRRPGGFESGNQLYLVTIEAVPIDYFNPEPGVEDGEIVPEEGFDSSLEQRPVLDDKDDQTTAIPSEFYEMPRFIYRIVVFKDVDGIPDLSTEVAKVGKVNSSANDPFNGATLREWMCIGIPMDKVGDNRWKLTYTYKHAGFDQNGDVQTWKDVADSMKDSGGNTKVTYSEGTIGP